MATRRRRKRRDSGPEGSVNVKRDFATVSEYFDASQASARANESSHTGSEYFTKTENFAAALDIGRFGWPEGARNVQRIREMIEDKLLTRIVKQSVSYDVSGSYVDVGRFCEGDPEHMVEFSEQEAPGIKTIRLAFNAGYAAVTETEHVETWGAAIVALVDAFEHAGTRVDLDAIVWLRGNGESSMLHTVNVKSAQDSLDIDRVSFIAAHPSFLRRVTFGVMEGMSTHERREMNVNCGYGYCKRAPDMPGVDVLIQSPTESPLKTIGAAISWIEDTLKANGVEINA